MRWPVLCASIFIGVGAATASSAQDAPQLPTVEAKREYDIGFDVSGIHDTNIAQSAKALAVSRGIHPEDWTVRPAATLSLTQPFGRSALFLRGSGGYDFHQQNSQLDSRRVDISGGATTRLSTCRVTVYGGYTIARTELAQLAGPITNNLEEHRYVAGGADCMRPRGIGGLLIVRREFVDNDNPIQKSLNATTNSITVGLNYANKSLGSYGLIASQINAEYPDRLVAPQTIGGVIGIGDKIIIQTLGLTGEKKIGPKIDVTGTISRTFLKRGAAPAPGQSRNSESNTYQADLTYKPTSRINLEVRGGRSVLPSNIVGKLYDTETNFEAIGGYRIGSKLSLLLGVQRQDETSNTDGTLNLLFYKKARTDAVYGSIRYQRSRKATLSVELRQVDRTTDLPIYDYSDTRLTLALSSSF